MVKNGIANITLFLELNIKQTILSTNYTAFSWYSEQINKILSLDLL